MKIARLLLPAILTLVSTCWAKDDNELKSPLILKGKLTSLDLESNESWRLKYQAHFDLEVVNVSDEKILLLRRDPVVVYSTSAQWKPEGEVVFEASESSSGSMMRSVLDHKRPPAESTILLKPGESYTTHTTIPLEFYPPSPDRHGQPYYPKSKMAKLELELAKWPFMVFDDLRKAKDEDGDDDYSFDESEFPEVLQKRWAKTGKLYLEHIESEPIEIPLPAQPDSPRHSGLVARGHVESIQMTEQTNTDISFTIELDLKFVNTGDRPVILLRPEVLGTFLGGEGGLWVVGAGVGDSRKAMEIGTYLHKNAWLPSNSRGDAWKRLQDALDQPSPPEYLVWVIPPGNATPSYRATTWLHFGKAPNTLDTAPPEKRNKLWAEIAGASDLWLDVMLEIWSFNIEPTVDPDNPEFGRSLRQRWASIGKLELGEEGRIISEPMELVLPSEYRQEVSTEASAKNE